MGTYFGGAGFEGNENGAFLTIDSYNNYIITGGTTSPGLATVNAYQTTLIDTVNGDIFLASLDSTGHFTTGVGEVNPKTSLIKVYPNPAKDKITINIKDYTGKGGSISLQSIEGKLLKQLSVKTETTSVDMSGFPSGTYLLQYEDEEGCEAVKVVKE